MNKILTSKLFFPAMVVIAVSGAVSGCATAPDGHLESAGCETGSNVGGAVVGAVGGAAVGSLIGAGTGNVLATVGGAAVGGYAGSRSRIGCRN